MTLVPGRQAKHRELVAIQVAKIGTVEARIVRVGTAKSRSAFILGAECDGLCVNLGHSLARGCQKGGHRPVSRRRWSVGYEPVGVIEKLGSALRGYREGQRLLAGAMANLTLVPDGLTAEQVLMCPDIMSTGFGGVESGKIRIGDTVAAFAQGPIGLCATAGANLMGATTIIGVETVLSRIREVVF